MVQDVQCLCGASFTKIDLTETKGWFTCPKCGCTTKPCVIVGQPRTVSIPEFDMKSIVAAAKGNKL